jgi:hypothetical protein
MRDETPLWATESDGEDATSERSGRTGWETLADPLLRALIGRSPRDLQVRAAALAALETAGGELPAVALEPAVAEALRSGGWIEATGAGEDRRFRWSEAGRRAYGAVSRLREEAAAPASPRTARAVVTPALTKSDLDELAAAGRAALVPVLPPPPLLTSDAVAHAAELQVLRSGSSRDDRAPSFPTLPPDAPRAFFPVEAERLLADLETIARLGEPIPLSRITEGGSAGESGLRLGLLTLAGSEAQRPAGLGIASRLAALPVAVEPGAVVPLAVSL